MKTDNTKTTYIYERVGTTVYAREIGSTEREVIRWDYDSQIEDQKPLIDQIKDSKLWGEIHRAAKTNPLLQEALERAIMIYHLSKKDGKE